MAWLKAAISGIGIGIIIVLGLFILDPPGPRHFINETASRYPAIKQLLESHPEIYSELYDELTEAYEEAGKEALPTTAVTVLDRVHPGVFLQYVVQAEPVILDRALRKRIQLLRQLDQDRDYALCNRPDISLPLEPGIWLSMSPQIADQVGDVLSDLLLSGVQHMQTQWPPVNGAKMAQLREIFTPAQRPRPSIVSSRGGDLDGLTLVGDPKEAEKCRRTIRFYEALSNLPLMDRTSYLRWEYTLQWEAALLVRPMSRLLAPRG